jgi:hypothetical protein
MTGGWKHKPPVLPVLLAAALVLGFSGSCKTGPAPADTVAPVVPAEPARTGTEAAEETAVPEAAEAVILLPPPGSAGEEIPLIEPELDLAESDIPAVFPPEPASPALPEPRAAEPPVFPAESPASVTPEAATQATTQATPPPVRPQTAPALPPEAPVSLRPVEPEPPSPAVRETPQVPAAPLPDLPARTPPAVQEEEIAFSRIVRATVGQLIEIPFRGTGWVYLGELRLRRGVDYDSRRLDPEGQSFIFRAAEPGTYVLKFYKEDFIRDYILNDYVQVIVGEAPDTAGAGWFNPPIDRGRVIAEPRWPLPVPPPGDGPGGGPGASPQPGTAEQTAPQTGLPAIQTGTPPSGISPGAMPKASPQAAPAAGSGEGPAAQEGPGTDSPLQDAVDWDFPDEYIRRARAEYEGGRFASALEIMGRFRERFPAGSDEAWWLCGQILEANSPARDIRSALDYYRRLIREYPQSSRYDDARRRIAYLERYYFTIQ